MGTLEIIAAISTVILNNGAWVFVFRMMSNRIKNIEEKMIDKETCHDRHGGVVKRLDKSDDKFADINDKFAKIMVAIGEVKTEVKNLKSA